MTTVVPLSNPTGPLPPTAQLLTSLVLAPLVLLTSQVVLASMPVPTSSLNQLAPLDTQLLVGPAPTATMTARFLSASAKPLPAPSRMTTTHRFFTSTRLL